MVKCCFLNQFFVEHSRVWNRKATQVFPHAPWLSFLSSLIKQKTFVIIENVLEKFWSKGSTSKLNVGFQFKFLTHTLHICVPTFIRELWWPLREHRTALWLPNSSCSFRMWLCTPVASKIVMGEWQLQKRRISECPPWLYQKRIYCAV